MSEAKDYVDLNDIRSKEAIVLKPDALVALRPGILEAYKTFMDNTGAILGGGISIDPYKMAPELELAAKLTHSFKKWLDKGEGELKYGGKNGKEIAKKVCCAIHIDVEEEQKILEAVNNIKSVEANLYTGYHAVNPDAVKQNIADILSEFSDEQKGKILQIAESNEYDLNPEYSAVVSLEGLSQEMKCEAIAAFNEFLQKYVKTQYRVREKQYSDTADNVIKLVLPHGEDSTELERSLRDIISPLERVGHAEGSSVTVSKDRKKTPYLGEHFTLKVPTPPQNDKHLGLGNFHRFVALLQQNGNTIDKAMYERLTKIGESGGEIFVNRKGVILVDIDNKPLTTQREVSEKFNAGKRVARNNPFKWEELLSEIRDKPAMKTEGFSLPPLESPSSPGKTEIIVTLSPKLVPKLAEKTKNRIVDIVRCKYGSVHVTAMPATRSDDQAASPTLP